MPAPPEPSDLLDLGDLQVYFAKPTSNLITIVLNKDGTVSFALPRCEVGQGITTSIGMLIAEELDLPLDKVCLLGCGITTGIGAVLNTAKVTPGSTVAVFGLGGIGLAVVQGAVMAKASRIIAVDLNASKWEMAKAMGATAVCDPANESAAEIVRGLTEGVGADVALDCVGNESSLDAALETTRKGGRIGVIGTFPVRPKVNMDRIGLEERELYGSLAYADDFSRAIALLADGRVDLSACVTARITLEEIVEKGFLEMQRKPQDHIRIIVSTQSPPIV